MGHREVILDETSHKDSMTEGSTSTWIGEPLSLVTDDERVEPPEILCRTDGMGLIYEGRLNVLFGQAESGKTWLALLACIQEIRKGHTVLFYDFEDYRDSARERMKAIGATDKELDLFYYARVESPLAEDIWEHEVRHQIEELAPTLVVIDSLDELMAIHGRNPDKSQDVREVRQKTVDRIKGLGPAVIVIDHVGHTNTGRQTGSQAKVSQLDGASILVDMQDSDKFGRGSSPGKAVLRIRKDRPGHLRGSVLSPDLIGTVYFEPGIEGAMEIYIQSARFAGTDEYDHSELRANKLLPFLKTHGPFDSANDWLTAMRTLDEGIKRDIFLRAVRQGVEMGQWDQTDSGAVSISKAAPVEEALDEL